MEFLKSLFRSAKNMKGFENAVRSATRREELLGLGVLGWHTLITTREVLPYESLLAQFKTREIFSQK